MKYITGATRNLNSNSWVAIMSWFIYLSYIVSTVSNVILGSLFPELNCKVELHSSVSNNMDGFFFIYKHVHDHKLIVNIYKKRHVCTKFDIYVFIKRKIVKTW